MTKSERLRYIAFMVFVVVALDQGSKYLAIQLLTDKGAISLLNDSVRFLLAENRGGFLSMGAALPEGMRRAIFLPVTAVLLLLFFLYTLFDKKLNRIMLNASALIIGGGIGNLLDRGFREGIVIDFVNIGIGNLRTGIFNLADVAVLGGCIILFYTLFIPVKQPH
ncbi:MAG: signal peptidase II [Desulfocapsaceae bacterium]|nr:signal peptidase II [Desulfocapsaceae bacterium]